MNRKLALFFDGTWNQQSSRTNVSRLCELTNAKRHFHATMGRQPREHPTDHKDAEQIKYYHQGVGVTVGEKIRGGAFGYGLSRNIKDGYRWLAEHYRPGDDIYVFGFSRGAYTARSLVGLIRKCGIPRLVDTDPGHPSHEGLTRQAYHIYREKMWSPDSRPAVAFKETFSWPETKIQFLGVWDTVGALGVPMHQVWFSSDWYRFHDTDLSRIVQNAFQALALDEHRPDFAATMWNKDKAPAEGQSVEQRWFPGSHADIGGGYARGTLYQSPLRWMQQNAQACGLEFTKDVPVDKEAYLGPIHNSLHDFAWGIYARLPWIYPYYRQRYLGVNETIDDSVKARMDSPEGTDEYGKRYRPVNMRG
jgi:uncharacterized protein (DUF2235 family)